MTRPNIKLAAVYLLLGLVATWAVAWGLALWGAEHPPMASRGGGEGQASSWPPAMPAGWRPPSGVRTVSMVGQSITYLWNNDTETAAYVVRLGLPVRSFESIEAVDWSSGTRSVPPLGAAHGIDTGVVVSFDGGWHRRLPLTPLWPGLIADTLFYAMLFACLHQLAGWGRRARRRRRGRCVACGYDLTGIDGPCPECGSGQPGRGATPAKGTDDV